MKQIAKTDPSLASHQHFLEQFQQVLMENLHYKKEQLPTIEICLREYASFEDNLHAMIQFAVDQKQFSKIYQSMDRM